MRLVLNGLYKLSAALAALCLCIIASLVLVQVLGRIIDGALRAFSLPILGLTVPSLNEIAGFLFVAATFLALASTLRQGDHIRVSMLIKAVGLRTRRVLETLVLAIGTSLAAFAAYHGVMQVVDSIAFHTVSFGTIRIPLAFPQAALAFGLIVFAVALADELVAVLAGAVPSYQIIEDEKTASLQAPVLTGQGGGKDAKTIEGAL